MKRYLALLVAVAVLGFAVSNVLARGGGHGGGHHGGGHHGGGHHGGHSHHGSHHHSHHGEHHHSHHHSGHHYHHTGWAHHGGWGGWGGGGWGGWGWGSPWAGVGFGAAATWLGLEGLNNATPIVGNYGGPAIVENTDNAETINNVPQTQTADTDDEGDDEEPVISDAQRAEANKLLQAGATDPDKGTKFLPLGVYSLAPRGQEDATALAQLAISKDGFVRGTYHDLLSNHDQPIRGKVDKKSQRVVFSFGEKGKVTFETSLANLTQATGGALVHSQGGETSQWTLARYKKEPTAKDEADDAADEAEDKAEDAKETAPEAPAAPANS